MSQEARGNAGSKAATAAPHLSLEASQFMGSGASRAELGSILLCHGMAHPLAPFDPQERLEKEKKLTSDLGCAATKLQELLKTTQDQLTKEKETVQKLQEQLDKTVSVLAMAPASPGSVGGPSTPGVQGRLENQAWGQDVVGTDSRKQMVGTAATLPQLPLGLGELGECFSDPYCQLGPPLAQPGYQGPHPNSGTSLSSYWLPPASGIHTGSPDLLGWVFSKGVGVVGGGVNSRGTGGL